MANHGIEAQHPDHFLIALFEAAPEDVCAAIQRQREGLRNPPKTAEELLAILEGQGLNRSVARLRSVVERL